MITCTTEQLKKSMNESEAWIKICKKRIAYLKEHPEKYEGVGWEQWYSVSCLENEIEKMHDVWKTILS